MSSEIVLNHHSLPFVCKEDAERGLLVFLDVLKSCRAAGLKILLVDEGQDKSLMGLELSSGYFVSSWCASAGKNPKLIDWCRFLKSLETKQPLFEKVDLSSLDNAFEVGCRGENFGKAVLLAAFHFKTFLISFIAVPEWSKPHIDVWVFELGVTPNQREDVLLNIYNDMSLRAHKEELKQRRDTLTNTAKNIWLQRNELFPHLFLLSNQIGTALQNWSARQDILLKARDALNVLETFGSKWSVGEYSDYRHEYLRDLGLAAEVSGESASVSNSPKKRKERVFWLENGQQIYCENHVKLPDGYRVYFYPHSAEKCIYVVYLGPHLTL